MLNGIEPIDDRPDCISWKFDKNKDFSIKSFSLQVQKLQHASNLEVTPTRVIWRGLAPPRVELLLWFVMLRKLNTKERLYRFNII